MLELDAMSLDHHDIERECMQRQMLGNGIHSYGDKPLALQWKQKAKTDCIENQQYLSWMKFTYCLEEREFVSCVKCLSVDWCTRTFYCEVRKHSPKVHEI